MKGLAVLRTATVTSAALGLLLVCAGPAVARDRPLPSSAPSPHDPHGYHRPGVTSITWSPDGRWLAASYFRLAFNRPGTDWDAWTAQWDLKTGKRLVLPNTFHPIAFRHDGQMMAMGLYDRSQGGFRWPSRVRLALWRPGADLTGHELPPPAGDGTSVVAATFSPDGKRVLAMTAKGSLLSWPMAKRGPAEVLAKLEKADLDGKFLRWHGSLPAPTMAFAGDDVLVTVLPSPLRRGGGKAVLWRYGQSSDRADAYVLKRQKTYEAGLITWDPRAAASVGSGGWAWPLGVEKAEGLAHPLARLYGAVAFSARARAVAFSGRGKVALRLWDGQRLADLPAGGGAVAFSPDGKRLAAADGRAIIRIWEVPSGRLLRTLRLDDRPANTVLVAAIQCHSKFGDPGANRKKLASLVRRAAGGGAKIVVLPETAVTGYLSSDLKQTWQAGRRPITRGLKGVDPRDAAETVPGPSTEAFGKLADECGVYLAVPLLEADRKTGRYYNTSVLLGPDGRILLHYRKRDPWPWAERGWATPGDRGTPVVDTPFGRLGLLICYDIHKQAAVMGRLKIDTLLYSVAWVEDMGSEWFAKQLPAVAKRHGFHVVAANWTVPKTPAPKWHGYGQSRIIDAAGQVLAKAKSDLKEEIVYAELPLSAAKPRGTTTDRAK